MSVTVVNFSSPPITQPTSRMFFGVMRWCGLLRQRQLQIVLLLLLLVRCNAGRGVGVGVLRQAGRGRRNAGHIGVGESGGDGDGFVRDRQLRLFEARLVLGLVVWRQMGGTERLLVGPGEAVGLYIRT